MPGLKSTLLRVGSRIGALPAMLRARKDAPRILMYHGVSPQSHFPGLRNAADLHLPRQHFIEHLRLLIKTRRVVGISELVQGLRHGEDMSNTIVITFDDGYENNVTQAAPVLADFKLPASFFLATNHIGTGRWIWTDRVEHAFDTSSMGRLQWSGLNLPLDSLPSRRNALREVKGKLKQMSVVERDEAVKSIGEALEVSEPAPLEDYRFMDWKQARSLADAGFEVGAHTMNHAILSRVSPLDAETEIVGSRNAVISGTGNCCPVFCYPNGKVHDYNAAVIDIARRHFDAAITTEQGVPSADDLFELPRQSAGGDGHALAIALMRRQSGVVRTPRP